MPVYNRESYIHLSIESVLKQSCHLFELILVDDGSTDNTGSICLNYAAKDSRVKYYKKENGGVSTARNYGLHHASGNYILFLDSDDSLTTNCLEILKNSICNVGASPDLIAFGTKTATNSWKATVYTVGKLLNKQKICENILPTHINIYSQDKNFILNYVWNKCYNTNFLQNNHLLFDENRRTWEDGCFVVECLSKANNLLLLPQILHIGCSDIAIEHLSSKFYPTQLSLYIQDETKFKRQFENLYDFNSEHYCRSNITTMNTLFLSAYNYCKKDAKKLIVSTLKAPIVLHWISNLDPKNSYEKVLKFCILKKKYHWMINFYRLNSLKNILLKIF